MILLDWLKNKGGKTLNIEELSIKEKISQMIMVGLDTNYITDRITRMISEYKIGGIILYRKNFNTYLQYVIIP